MIRAGFVMTGFMVVAGCSTVEMPEAPPLRSQTSTTVGHPPLARRPAPVLHEKEERWRDRAALLMRDDRWADAALQWELLVLLRPDNSEYERALQDTRVRIAKLAAERQRRAEERPLIAEPRTGRHERLVLVLSADRPKAVEA